MSGRFEVRIPKFPECWNDCGACGQGDVSIDDVLVFPGDHVDRDDNVIVLETGKVAMDIPSPREGTVVEVCVAPGDVVTEGDLILVLELD